MKKFLALLLSAMMLLGVVPALAADAPVEITILLNGNTVSDDTAVLEQLNPYLQEKIGVTLKPVWGTWANFDDLALNAVNTGSDEYDIMFTCSWTKNDYAKYSKAGRLRSPGRPGRQLHRTVRRGPEGGAS